MLKASHFHAQGFTCAEAIIKAYNANHGTNYSSSIGTGLGAGVFSGSLCGSVNAAAIIIGLERGRESADQPNEAGPITRKLMQAVNEKYGSVLCSDLKKNRVTCGHIIDFTYDTLTGLLSK